MKRRAENPLLSYQLLVFTRNRWKRQPLLYGAVAVSVGLAYLLLFQLVLLGEPSVIAVWTTILTAMCILAPLFAYNLFSLEYEKQTWEALALTRLSAWDILWGKWGAALARIGFTLLLFSPMLAASSPGTLRPYPLLAGALVVLGWGVLLVSAGMWLSFKLKRTLPAASTLYAGQVLLLMLLPLLYYNLLGGKAPSPQLPTNYIEGVWWWGQSLAQMRWIVDLNPFATLARLEEVTRINQEVPDEAQGLFYLNWGFVQGVLYILIALLFAGLTYRGLKLAWRK